MVLIKDTECINHVSGTNARKSHDDEPTDDEEPRQMNWIKMYGKEYYFQNEAKDQVTAQVYCKNQKGMLFEPKNATVNKDVAALAIKNRQIVVIKPKIWLGFRYSSSKELFVYESNGKSIDWKNWKTGQPEGDGRQNCVIHQNKWVDVNCNEKHVFICERGKTTHANGTRKCTIQGIGILVQSSKINH